MIYYAMVFLVVVLIAGAVGFGGIAGVGAAVAQGLFFLFFGCLVLSVIGSLMRRT